jgi:L-alanine-DL-glutamate epimerase-like enolase superfamily enzyme
MTNELFPRRAFLSAAARTGCALSLGSILPACRSTRNPSPTGSDGWTPPPLPSDLPRDVFITRVSLVPIRSPRPKYIGKNAARDDHGEWQDDNLLRLFTNSGLCALGTGDRVSPDMAEPLLGKSLADLAGPDGFPEPFRRMDLALWDLLGKATGRPVWKLLGGAGPRDVPVYDGTIYLSDLIHTSRGAARPAEEVEQGLARGYRAFKLKIGRGFKWMTPWETGFARDLEVVRACRKTAGPSVTLMVDANNGYEVVTPDGKTDYPASIARVAALLDAAGDQDLHMIEEMFRENPDAYRGLIAEIRNRGLKTLHADGENMGEFAQAEPYLPERLIEVIQPNIKLWGLTRWRRLAALARRHGVICTPHNWGSRIGLYACLQLGRGIPNLGFVEEDVATQDLFDTGGWTLRNGRYAVPDDRPGLGIEVREDVYRERYAGREAWVVTA